MTQSKERGAPKRGVTWEKLWIPLIVGAASAIGGYLFHAAQEHRSSQRDRVTAQLETLYIPLRTKLQENNAAWDDFSRSWIGNRSSFFDGNPRSKRDIEIWRSYILESAQKQNLAMESLISEHARLWVDGRIPSIFEKIVGHTENYKAVIARWGKSVSGDAKSYTAEENTTLVNFPDRAKLAKCLDDQIHLLEEARSKLDNPLVGLVNKIEEKVAESCKDAN